MYRFVRTSLTTIGLTSIALAALAGGRAQSADTDLQPALQQIRDEVRDLRHDVKALRELLEKKSPPAVPAQSVEKQPGISALAGDGIYYLYSRTDALSPLMTFMIDHLQGQGYSIKKIEVAENLRHEYGVDLDPISFQPLLILKRGGESQVLRGLQPEDTLRSKVAAYFGKQTTSQEKPSTANEPGPHDPSLEAWFFYAKWSGPSQQMLPLIDKLRAEGHRIAKVDIDTDKELATRFNVTVVPTLWLAVFEPQSLPLQGVQTEEQIRAELNKRAVHGPSGTGFLGDRSGAAATLPDRKVVQIENYIESVAGDGGKKMTGNEMIASVDGHPVFASDIFRRAGADPLTPDGTSLATAKKALAAGQIDEPSFRQLQLLALRKFAQKYLNTRGWAQAMIASLGKAEREKAENAITDEFNKYVEKLKQDFKVATAFDVDKKLREQGTSLLSLKAEFRDRLLADEFVRGATKRTVEAPDKRSQFQAAGIDLDRRVTIDCDERPLTEVLDKIFRDEPIVNFSYDQALGTFHYPIVHPIVHYLPAIQNETMLGRQFASVVEYVDANCPKRVTLHVKDVPVAVALQRVFEQTPLDCWIENGVLRIDLQAEKRVHRALRRKVTFDCEKLPLRRFIRQLENDWQLGEFSISGAVDLEAPITLHVADATVEAVLKLVCEQAHVSWEFRNGRFFLSPAVNATEEDRRIGELIARRQADPEGKLITEIVVEGNSKIPASAILQKLKVTTGRKASTKEIQDDVRTLWQTGWFNTVETRFRDPLKGPGQVLVFVLIERPSIPRVQPAGNKDIETKKLEPLVLLAYPVADLLATPPPSLPPQKIDFQPLESLIQAATDVKSWKGSGGAGQIEHVDKTLSLVIRQTPEVHQQIANVLQKLREPRQLHVTFRAAVLDHRISKLLEGSSIKLPSEVGTDFTCLTKAQSDFLMRSSDGALVLERLPVATVAVGKDVTIPTRQGQNVWPQAVRLRTGQLAGRLYLWLDFLGNNPVSATPLQTTVQSRLLPDLRPVLIEMKSAHVSAEQSSPWDSSHTVDQVVGKPQEHKYLLISPEIEVGTPYASPGPRQ